MKIDRHNYEEYFLLYIDNELTVEQKKQVELFVKENPDLEEELVMLQQLKLIPDKTIVFDKKDLLMKEENNSFINMNNYEEWLILYLDNELNEEERVVVEKFAAAHPRVQQELNLFQQTKLQSEKIIFTGKEVLYKKERVTVISMLWWRVAVAAILIIAAGITLYSILNKRSSIGNSEVAKKEIKKDQVPNSAKAVSPNKTEPNTPIVKDEEQPTVTAPVNKRSGKEKKLPGNNLRKEKPASDLATNQIRSDVFATINSSNDINNPQIKSTITLKAKQFFKDSTVTKPPSETPEPIYVNNNTENKRLRGFFRKASRLIERTTNINPANDDNKVLIGGMAFNLK